MKIKILPLKWEPHHVKDNGWIGTNSNGDDVYYIYPATRRVWSVFYYRVLNSDSFDLKHPKTRKRVYFKTPRAAKCFAQAHWRREVQKLVKSP